MPSNNNTSNMDLLIDQINSMVSNSNANIFELAEMKRRLEQIVRDLPVQEVRELKEIFKDNSEEVESVFKKVLNSYNDRLRAEEEYRERIRNINSEIDSLKRLMENANSEDRAFYARKLEAQERDLEREESLRQIMLEGREKDYQIEQELNQKRRESINSLIDTVASGASALLQQFTSLVSNAISNVASVYERNAGNMSASLNLSVSDINNLQTTIANSIRNASLGSAISNIEVFNEASNLVSQGFTNYSNLENTATGITIGREIAPNLNFDTYQVKNLTNIFGSDFITRFSAIQAAVQETAGATIGLNERVSKMMTDLEPVYQNAQYSLTALQDTSDIQATLSAAQDAGIITSTQANEYLQMISELMDPSRAFKSNNTAVRVAATTYDFGSGSSLQALQALLNARQQMYGSVSMANDYWGNISRSLVASAYGDDTMSATYMPSGLYGLDILRTSNLDSVYSDTYNNLQRGNYTTQRERERNAISNSNIIQSIATFSEDFPITFDTFSSSLFSIINSLPVKIAAAIKIGDGLTSSLGSLLGKSGSTLSSIGSGLFGSGGAAISGTTVATLGAGAAGIGGLINLFGGWNTEQSTSQNVGFGGNYLESALTWGGIGAGFGTLGGPLGSLAGGLIGAVFGLTNALVAQTEVQEENTAALTSNTDMINHNMSELEIQKYTSNGQGVAHLSSGDYVIDYVPSSYPGFASGLDYVPYDGFIARLHRGESIVTASAANRLRSIDPNYWYTGDTIVSALREQTSNLVDAISGNIRYQPLTSSAPQTYVITNKNI